MDDKPISNSTRWGGAVTAEMIAAGRAASLEACHQDAPIDLQVEAMYRAMRAREPVKLMTRQEALEQIGYKEPPNEQL